MSTLGKRMLTAVGLGALGGLVCAWGASTHGVPGALDIHAAMFWGTMVNRILLGFVVGLAGVVTLHPIITSVHLNPILRGVGLGVAFSLPMAIGTLITHPQDWGTFGFILLMGVIIATLIDLVVSRLYGEGAALLDYER